MRSPKRLPFTHSQWPPVSTELIEYLERLFPPLPNNTPDLDVRRIDHAAGARAVVEKIRAVHDEQRKPEL